MTPNEILKANLELLAAQPDPISYSRAVEDAFAYDLKTPGVVWSRKDGNGKIVHRKNVRGKWFVHVQFKKCLRVISEAQLRTPDKRKEK